LLLALFALFIFARTGWQYLDVDLPADEANETAATEHGGLVAGPCEVVRVVDGDTIILRQSAVAESLKEPQHRQAQTAAQYRVRLLGIDTPETVKEGTGIQAWGPEATVFTRDFLQRGLLRVELDKRRIDRFGRSLAYVYVGDELLNAEIVRAGLARVSAYPGDSLAILKLLRQAEAEAREARRGIWSEGSPRRLEPAID